MNPDNAHTILAEVRSDPAIQRLQELSEQAAKEGAPKAETIEAIGGRYPLGDGSVGPIRPGAMLALAVISSPLLGQPDDLREADAFRALYAIEAGDTALDPLLGLDCRIRAAQRYEDKALADSELFAVYLSHLDSIERDAWRKFDAEATAFCARECGNWSPADALELGARALSDAMAPADMASAKPGKKKAQDTSPQDSTLTGSQAWRPLWRQISTLIRARLPGVFRWRNATG